MPDFSVDREASARQMVVHSGADEIISGGQLEEIASSDGDDRVSIPLPQAPLAMQSGEFSAVSSANQYDSSPNLVTDAFPPSFISSPPPPSGCWDTDDVQYLEKISCHVWIRLTHISPKNGRFEGRMKFQWQLRSLNTKERTEPRRRVPGIRMPRLHCKVEESRVWRNFDGDTDTTIAWQGISVLSFAGFEIFEVYDFPFDRQVIDLDLLEFVWRDHKNTDRFYEAMKIVSFTCETISMLPEWDSWPAIIEPKNKTKAGTGPSYATRFGMKIRVQRKEKYYITQIFMVTYLITSASLLPLALAPGTQYIGSRIGLYSGGLLTLVAFDYSVSHELPSVPYTTCASVYLTRQLSTIVAVAFESIASYKLIKEGWMERKLLGEIEDGVLVFLLLAWLMYFLYIAVCQRRRKWEDVVNDQASQTELKDDFEQERRHSQTGGSAMRALGSMLLQLDKKDFADMSIMAVDTTVSSKSVPHKRPVAKLNGTAKPTNLTSL